MFKLITCEDLVRIPPDRFGEKLEEVAKEQLKLKYEGMVDEELGYVILLKDVKVDPVGKIRIGDGATYHKATFTLLTFMPMLQEIIEGEVVEIVEYGAFVRVGPVDCLLHSSQIMDDTLSYDRRQGILVGKKTGRVLRIGDKVRARIIAVSLTKGGHSGKIGITARQPFLGKLEWIEEEVKKIRKAKEKVAKK